MMEVYAGALSYADNQIGRLVDAVDQSGQLENTLVIFLMGDNGASAEGTLQGTTNEVATAANGVQESVPYLLSMMDELGGQKRITTIQSVGRTPWMRQCNGQSKSLPISEAHGMAW